LIVLVAALSPGAVSAEGALVHKPRIPIEAPAGTKHAGWLSSNWSGYALSGSNFTSITGSWTVQAVSRSRRSTYSSQWVGIDGFNNSNLIQTGTESDFVNGQARYDAWWEILPAAETVIPSATLNIHPGDHMSASVTKGAGTSWTISISDTSTGQSFTTIQTYTGPETSAEWVEEAPTVGGHVATLANYGLTTFDPGTVNGRNPGLTPSASGAMIQRNVQVSTPSNPDADADGFNMQYGSTVPAPPPT
jgi:hypothetical protein